MGQSAPLAAPSPPAFSPAFFKVGRAYPHSGRFSLRHDASVSGFPLAWLTTRMACRPSGDRWDLPSSWRFSCHMPGTPTPTDPRESHHAETLDRSLFSLLSAWLPGGATLSRSSSRLNDSFVLASVLLTTPPSAFTPLTRLKSFGVVHHPSCLGHSLCTLHLSCSHGLRHKPPVTFRQRRNTRHGWVASPYPTGTFTRQETPSFAWRTNKKTLPTLPGLK